MTDTNTSPKEQFFNKLLKRVNGLKAIIISGPDNSIKFKVATEELETTFPATYSLVSEQANKLQMGETKSITAFYDDYQVVQAPLSENLIVSFISGEGTPTQLLMDFIPSLKNIALE